MPVQKLRKYLPLALMPVLGLGATSASADWGLNMTRGVTPISEQVYDLHMLILWIVTLIGIGVFGVMFWSIFHHRKDKGAVAAKFHHNTTAEAVWTIIPILILVIMAIPATKTLIKMEETGDADITIKITGYQWKWKYDYLNEGFGFFSVITQASRDASARGSGINPGAVDNYLLDVDRPVVIPANRKVRLLTTANDVIHAWWVPALGWKRDAIPGFINDNWAIVTKPGVYRGQCAELCGKDHAYMPIVLKVVPEDEYNAWVAEMKLAQAEAAAGADREWGMEELSSKGQEVYTTTCAVCHQATGQGIPGTFPALAGSAIATGPVAGHIAMVLNGKNLMPAFSAQLSDTDIAAVITYERNSWGNSTGEAVQPKDVKAAR